MPVQSFDCLVEPLIVCLIEAKNLARHTGNYGHHCKPKSQLQFHVGFLAGPYLCKAPIHMLSQQLNGRVEPVDIVLHRFHISLHLRKSMHSLCIDPLSRILSLDRRLGGLFPAMRIFGTGQLIFCEIPLLDGKL